MSHDSSQAASTPAVNGQDAHGHDAHAKPKGSGFWILALGSVGVVFGDIGTSPLYALREAAQR